MGLYGSEIPERKEGMDTGIVPVVPVSEMFEGQLVGSIQLKLQVWVPFLIARSLGRVILKPTFFRFVTPYGLMFVEDDVLLRIVVQDDGFSP